MECDKNWDYWDDIFLISLKHYFGWNGERLNGNMIFLNTFLFKRMGQDKMEWDENWDYRDDIFLNLIETLFWVEREEIEW